MSENSMSTRKKELLRCLPFAVLFGATLCFYKGDYEAVVGAIYLLTVIAFTGLVTNYIVKSIASYANGEAAWNKAMENPLTAALVWLGRLAFLFGIIWLAVGVISPSKAHGAIEPSAKAQRYLPLLKGSFDTHWPTAPLRHYAAGQIEQESGWNERAELKTAREYGFGLGQITVTDRFNTFEEAQKIFRDWKWEDRFNVKYQLGYAVITDRSNFHQVSRLFSDDDSRWRGSLVAYNAGYGTVLQRRALATRKGVPADRWTGGLDQVAMGYETKLLYGRPLAERRNEYPHLICDVRSAKYKGWL